MISLVLLPLNDNYSEEERPPKRTVKKSSKCQNQMPKSSLVPPSGHLAERQTRKQVHALDQVEYLTVN